MLSRLVGQFPQHTFYGYEWNPVPYLVAKKRFAKHQNTQIIKADLMKTDLKHLDVVFFYLGHIPGLGNRLKQALKPSAIVISKVFEVKGWKPKKVIETRLLGFKSKVFVYQVRDQKRQQP